MASSPPQVQAAGAVHNWYALLVVLLLAGELLGLAGMRLAGPHPDILAAGLALVAAALIGAGVAAVLLDWLVLDRLRRMAGEVAELQEQAIAGQAVAGALASRTEQLRKLRHDLRGALSPALLVADRLTGHADPAVQRSGQIMMRTVERATLLLTDPDALPRD